MATAAFAGTTLDLRRVMANDRRLEVRRRPFQRVGGRDERRRVAAREGGANRIDPERTILEKHADDLAAQRGVASRLAFERREVEDGRWIC